MVSSVTRRQSARFRIGWGLLLLLAGGNVLAHLALYFFVQDPLQDFIFIPWAAFNLLAAMILAIPYRQGQAWAWYAVWAMIAPYVAALLFFPTQPEAQVYFGEAILMSVCQVMTYSSFSRSASA